MVVADGFTVFDDGHDLVQLVSSNVVSKLECRRPNSAFHLTIRSSEGVTPVHKVHGSARRALKQNFVNHSFHIRVAIIVYR